LRLFVSNQAQSHQELIIFRVLIVLYFRCINQPTAGLAAMKMKYLH